MTNPIVKTLPLSFSQSFLLDRDLLARLLRFASNNGSGSKEAISLETGIPTGKSTGKVEPMIHYAQGMGLICADKEKAVWRLSLTTLGQAVFSQDAALSEPMTLWLLHLMFSRRSGLTNPATGVADAWFTLFAEGTYRLGKRFNQADYLAFLQERHGDKAILKTLSSLVLRSYFEPRALGGAGILQESIDNREHCYVRLEAPFQTHFFPAYAAYFYLLWDELFADREQLAFDEFSVQTRWPMLLAWEESWSVILLDWMADRGLIQLDRHTGAAVILRLQSTEQVVVKLYDGLV